MKKIATIFLQVVVVLLGLTVLAFMLWEPHLEGRNVHATTFEIYFNDPFLAFAYLASIPFFVGLWQTFRVLGEIRQGNTISRQTVRSLQIISVSARTMIVLALLGLMFILRSDSDDPAGGVFMGFLVLIVSLAVANFAARLKRKVEKTLI